MSLVSLNRRGVLLHDDAPPLLIIPEKTAPSVDTITVESERLNARARAILEALVHYGTASTIDIVNTIRVPSITLNIVSFVVPNGQQAIITHLGFTCDNPAVTMNNQVVWRLLVDGNEAPFMNTSVLFNRTGYRVMVSSIYKPMQIHPVVAQSGQRVVIEAVPSVTIAAQNHVFMGRLVGKLVNPGSFGVLSLGMNV